MKNPIRTITALLLSAFFLVSFTGIRLLVHHCAGCGTSEIVLAAQSVSCCSNQHAAGDLTFHGSFSDDLLSDDLNTEKLSLEDFSLEDLHSADMSLEDLSSADFSSDNGLATCCMASGPGLCDSGCGDSCCDFETIYLKGDYEFTLAKTAATLHAPVMDVPAVISGPAHDTVLQQNNLTEPSFTDPPPKPAGRAFVLFAHQIKILA